MNETNNLKNLPEGARFTRSVSVGQIFVSASTSMLTGYSVTHTIPRDDSSAYPKGIMNNDTQISPVLRVLVALHFDQYGIEVIP